MLEYTNYIIFNVMKKSILNFKGVEVISKENQKTIIAGAQPVAIPCGYICLPGCRIGCPM